LIRGEFTKLRIFKIYSKEKIMKIIHTSDWHLGKTLDGFSRLAEQEEFIEEFVQLVNEQEADLVIIAGDIYDSSNPPARAETLFYNAVKRLSNFGKRAILVVAGNHDNPERLEAAAPLAKEHGIIILGSPRSLAEIGTYGSFKIIDAGESFVEIELNNEKAVIITLPYPSERRLEEILTEDLGEVERQRTYSQRVGEIFQKLSLRYREDTINLAVSHIFLLGGESTDSERPIQLGGSFAVELDKLPNKAQYIALGHLHKTQRFNIKGTEVIYSGSPIQYSKSERNNCNCVYAIEVKARSVAVIEKLFLRNYKPIEVWKCSSIQDVLNKCEELSEKDMWVYIEVKTDRVLLQEEIKEMKRLRRDIIEIIPKMDGLDDQEDIEYESLSSKSMKEVFEEFYKKQRLVEPTEELTSLFLSITSGEEEGEEDEAKET
jgi:exonuclease SbcD